jgi:hypothetical protein
MTSKSVEKKNAARWKANRVFNIAEKPVRDFITNWVANKEVVLFTDETPTYVEPLILLPFDEYKEGVCLKFTISSEPYAPHTLVEPNPGGFLDIDDIIEHKKVKEGIGFLLFCVKETFASVVRSSMASMFPIGEEVNMKHVHIELNETNWTLCPKYIDPAIQYKEDLEIALGKMMYVQKNLDKFSPDVAKKLMEQYPKLIDELAKDSSKPGIDIYNNDKTLNNGFLERSVIHIRVEEMLEKDLPKQIRPEDVEKIIDIGEKNNDICEESYDIEDNVGKLFNQQLKL